MILYTVQFTNWMSSTRSYVIALSIKRDLQSDYKPEKKHILAKVENERCLNEITEPLLSLFGEQERLLKVARSRVPVGLDISTESGDVEKR